MDAIDSPPATPTRQPRQPLVYWRKAAIALPLCIALIMPTHLTAETAFTEPPLPQIANLSLRAGAPLLPTIAAAAANNPAEDAAAQEDENEIQPFPEVAPLPDLPPEPEEGTCVVFGEVSDETTLDPVPGAIIDAVGTGIAVETDANGRFRFENLPEGTITIEATQLGYFSAVIVVTTLEGQPVEARLGLRARPADDGEAEYMLDEEIIIGEYQEENQGDLFIDLQISSTVTAGISREEFSRAAVSDAAGAVSKISGANIVGGRYAVVRGLGDRYSNTTLNGSLISSADPSRKAVQLDLFPAHLLQSINISKTFQPYMPAEFAGGLVQIETMRFPTEPIVEFKYGLETNSNLSKGDPFYAIKGRSLGFWGNSRQGALPKDGLRTLANPTTATLARRKEVMENIHSSQGFRPIKVTPDEFAPSFELTLGRSFEIADGITLGLLGAFTHEKGDEAILDYEVGRRFSNILGAPSRNFTKDEYTRYVEWGGLFGAGLKLGENHEIGFTYFTNNKSEDTVTRASRVNTPDTADIIKINGQTVIQPKLVSTPNSVYGPAYTIYRGFDQIEPLFRGLDVRQLSGRHRFGKDGRGPSIDWAVAHSDAIEERPHTSTFYFSQLDFADPRIANSTYRARIRNPNAPPTFINVNLPEAYDPSRGLQETSADPLLLIPPDVESFRESLKTEESATDANLSVTLPYYFNEKNDDRFEFRFGAASFSKKREVRGDFLIYRMPSQFNINRLLNPANQGQFGIDDAANIDSLKLPDGTDRFNGSLTSSNFVYYEDFTGRGFTERNVNASTNVDAIFAMGSLYLNNWDISGGIRRETEVRGFELLNEAGGFRSGDSQKNANDLFGLSASRAFGNNDAHNLLIAHSRTIARPTFYEFAPVFTKDQASGDSISGNSSLADSLVDNFDIGYSYSPDPGIRYGLNFFYKEIGDPIVKVLNPTGTISWINAQSGTIRGVELEVEKRFNDYLSLTANYTRIESDQKVRQLSAGQVLEYNSTFEGQPDQIANVILGFDIPDHRIRASLVYNYTDEHLFALPANPVVGSPIVQRPRHTLDFVLSKGFSTFGLDGTLSFKVSNLLNTKVERGVQGLDTDLGVYDRYSPGRSYSASCKISF